MSPALPYQDPAASHRSKARSSHVRSWWRLKTWICGRVTVLVRDSRISKPCDGLAQENRQGHLPVPPPAITATQQPLPAAASEPHNAGSKRGLRADHGFFSIIAVLLACTIIGGFSRTYFLKTLTGAPPLPFFVHVHAAVFTSWLVLFVVQTSLVRHGRVDLHRRLGAAGTVLAAAMLIVGPVTAVLAARQGYNGGPPQFFPDPESFLIVPLRDISIFAILIAVGLFNRHKPEVHKRSMLTAVIGGLLPPGAVRLALTIGFPQVIGGIILLFVLSGPVYDWVRYRRVYAVYGWGGLLTMLTLPPELGPIAGTHVWHEVAAWLISY